MKLYIVQEGEESVAGRAIKIYDDRGEQLPGVTEVVIHHCIDDASRLGISLVVDDRDIVFGKPPRSVEPPPDRNRRRS